jgi:hypothetical protein
MTDLTFADCRRFFSWEIEEYKTLRKRLNAKAALLDASDREGYAALFGLTVDELDKAIAEQMHPLDAKCVLRLTHREVPLSEITELNQDGSRTPTHQLNGWIGPAGMLICDEVAQLITVEWFRQRENDSRIARDASALMTIGPLARHLGVSTKWLRQAAERGEIPCVRAGDGYFFDRDLVVKVLLERAQETIAPVT